MHELCACKEKLRAKHLGHMYARVNPYNANYFLILETKGFTPI